MNVQFQPMNPTIILLNVNRSDRLFPDVHHNSVCSPGLKWLCLPVLWIFCSSLFAQAATFPGIHTGSLDVLWQNHLAGAGFQTYHLSRLHISRLSPPAFSTGTAIAYHRIPLFYPDKTRLPWSEECLPFFCRIERQWGKNKTLPVKFRLGSVDYVDWLEGKARFSSFEP